MKKTKKRLPCSGSTKHNSRVGHVHQSSHAVTPAGGEFHCHATHGFLGSLARLVLSFVILSQHEGFVQ
jgi:hypothetical protein